VTVLTGEALASATGEAQYFGSLPAVGVEAPWFWAATLIVANAAMTNARRANRRTGFPFHSQRVSELKRCGK
jgi:hypothetical protein